MNINLADFRCELEIDQLFIPHRCKISSQRRILGHFFGLQSAIFSSLLRFLFIEPFNEHPHPNAQASSFNRTSESALKAKSVRLVNSWEFWGCNPQFSKHQTLCNVNSMCPRVRTVFWKPCPCLHNKYIRFWSLFLCSNNIETWLFFSNTFYFYNTYKLLLFNLYKI